MMIRFVYDEMMDGVRTMEPYLENYFPIVEDLKTKKEFETEVNQRYETYGFLLDKETIALLLVDELGRNMQNIHSIAKIQPGMDCTIIGTVVKEPTVRCFNRSNGSMGRVTNLLVSDETGTITVVLWDDDTQLIQEGKIQQQTRLKIINGYTKKGYTGVELIVGKWSDIEILDTKQIKTKPQHIPKQTKKLSGKILSLGPTKPFFRSDGSYGFVASLQLQTAEGKQHLTIWDEQVKHLQSYRTGDTIQISQVEQRNRNHKTEYHVNGQATITKD